MGDWLLPSARRARGAEALARLLPEPLEFTFFTASGAEAVEVACKLARSVTGRTGFVCAEHGYHGHVGFSLAMDDPPLSERYQPLTPGITRVPFGDAEALRDAVGPDTAAVIMETIPATGGYLVPPDGYFAEMRRICDETGALMILDEVQAGLGRTGRVWAFEHFDVVPDVVIVGKGLSAGVYPVAACCFGERVEAHFADGPLLPPLQLRRLRARRAGGRGGRRALRGARADGARRGDGRAPRGRASTSSSRAGPTGSRVTVAWGSCGRSTRSSDAMGLELTKQCFAHGLLAIFAFNRQATLQVMPPLVISEAEIDEVLERLDAAVAAM